MTIGNAKFELVRAGRTCPRCGNSTEQQALELFGG